jgi:16S rRNA (cytidine1402-2'-O)-methyltransferase
MSGRLVVCPTPIGNLEDVTLRVLSVLREADLIACEDTRTTKVLLDRYGVSAERVRYDANVERRVAPRLVERMRGGAVRWSATRACPW